MTSRWPLAAFISLAVATFGAFFIVQHLKVATPLINGFPAPFPRTFNPVAGGVCRLRTGRGVARAVSFRRMKVSFYLQNRADAVDVYIVDPAGRQVRQIGFDARMRVKVRRTFYWDGRLADGSIAPDGEYEIRVDLIHQGRSFVISDQSTGAPEPVTVDTAVPRPVVTAVTPASIPASGGRVVAIRYSGAVPGVRRVRVLIYRAAGGRLRLVKGFEASPRASTVSWDGMIAGRPAPRGSYLVAVRVTNSACTTGTSPLTVAAAPRAVLAVG